MTVSRALAVLVAEGRAVTRPGSGSFIATPPPRRGEPDLSWQSVVLAERSVDASGMSPLFDPPADDRLISLATGYLHPSLMPIRALGGALARAARRPDAWERPPAAGLHALRTWFARQAGPSVDRRDVLVTPGGQGALTTVFRALVRPGGPLLMESPTYPGALAVAHSAGLRPVPVPTDADGVIPQLLDEAFARTGAQAFYCQPTYQNPTGSVLSPARRTEVLAVAAAARAFVVEDDFARWLGQGDRPPATMCSEDADGRVVYISSLTKVASPSLRVGAVIAMGPLAQRLLAMRVVDDMFVARPLQEATLDLVSRPAWGQHLADLAVALGRRRAALLAVIAEQLPAVEVVAMPRGGMHLWLRLPPGCDDVEVAQRAREGGVMVSAGSPFFPAEAPAAHLRLTYASAASEADLAEGVRRLAAAAPALRS